MADSTWKIVYRSLYIVYRNVKRNPKREDLSPKQIQISKFKAHMPKEASFIDNLHTAHGGADARDDSTLRAFDMCILILFSVPCLDIRILFPVYIDTGTM